MKATVNIKLADIVELVNIIESVNIVDLTNLYSKYVWLT